MKRCTVLMFVFVCLASDIFSLENGSGKTVLSRKKRYLIFPEGATWSVALCSAIKLLRPINEFGWVEAVQWGFAFDLPYNRSDYDPLLRSKYLVQRRNRRDVYNKMETVLNSMGYNGRSCIYRALCEAAQKLSPRGNTISESILKLIFRFPMQRLLASEPEEHRLYHRAYRIGADDGESEKCSDIFPHCPFSLIDVALSGFTNF